MGKLMQVQENGLNLVFEIADDGDLRFLHCSSLSFNEASVPQATRSRYRLVEIQAAGENQDDHHGEKHTGTSPGSRLRYRSHSDIRNDMGRKLEFYLRDDSDLDVTVHLQFYDGIPVVRSWTDVHNCGGDAVVLEYVSSFALTGVVKEGLGSWDRKSRLHTGHNTWQREAQWKAYSLPELGLHPADRHAGFSLKRIAVSSSGTWPASNYLPVGLLENTETGTFLAWEIEHNGSWLWEISDVCSRLYLQLSGPAENEHHWSRKLMPGDRFTSVPVAVTSVSGPFDAAIAALTRYRRRIRRPNADNENLPVIFNDYMNCLNGDPTTAKLIPLIEAAARAGCEYFCIDAGWYADGGWWDGVGEWLPSSRRFPGGIEEPLEYIRSHGMIPGLWLELEVMGINCPLATELPDECFFMRHGKRVIDHSRYQLDFRHPRVIQHANAVIDRLVNEYGVGYIKMDYNINAGIGTEVNADSFGDGLLRHNRAYLAWLDSIFERYPDLVIENCSSGGMRMTTALLRRQSIQSSSDQTDYRFYAAIAPGCLTAVTPEQCATWSYPQRGGDREEVVFNMVNAMLMRIHQSGHLAELDPDCFALVKEGIGCYKGIRDDIKNGVPFWPLGLPSFDDPWVALGLDCGERIYVAVWRRGADDADCFIPISRLAGKTVKADCIYPHEHDTRYLWNPGSSRLSVRLPAPVCARLFRIKGV